MSALAVAEITSRNANKNGFLCFTTVIAVENASKAVRLGSAARRWIRSNPSDARCHRESSYNPVRSGDSSADLWTTEKTYVTEDAEDAEDEQEDLARRSRNRSGVSIFVTERTEAEPEVTEAEFGTEYEAILCVLRLNLRVLCVEDCAPCGAAQSKPRACLTTDDTDEHG